MSIFKDVISEQKSLLIAGACVLTVVSSISLWLVSTRNNHIQLKTEDVANVDVESFEDDFFQTVPVEKKEEVVTKKVETKKPKAQPRPNFRATRAREKLKTRDVFNEEIQSDVLVKEMKAKIYLAKIHQSTATQIWSDDKRFEHAFKDQPLNQLKKARKYKDRVNGAFGEVDQFCDIGEDCLKGSKPTHLDYTILKGTRIPIVLTQTIVSDIPTSVCEAQVSQDVSGFHGDNILIPKYSKAVCKVVEVKDPAQKRLQLVFTDIFTPNGVRIKGALAGADMVGSEGAQGLVDSRLMERVGFPLFTAAIPITVAYTLPASTTEDEDRRNSAVEGVTQALQPILNAELDRNLNTMPRITVPAGSLMQIKPLENIVFEKVRDGKIMPTWQ